MLVWVLDIPSPWNICATMRAMITSTLQIFAAAIRTVGSAPTPAFPIPKTVNACWKPLLLNCLKTIGRSLKSSDIREDGATASSPDNSGQQNLAIASSRKLLLKPLRLELIEEAPLSLQDYPVVDVVDPHRIGLRKQHREWGGALAFLNGYDHHFRILGNELGRF